MTMKEYTVLLFVDFFQLPNFLESMHVLFRAFLLRANMPALGNNFIILNDGRILLAAAYNA